MIEPRLPWVWSGALVGATVVVAIVTRRAPAPPVLPDPRLAGELATIAKRYLATHPETTCDVTPRSGLETRIARWIDRRFPDETDDGNLVVTTACDDIVVVDEDRTSKGHPDDDARVHARSTARSWILRVGRSIEVLATAEGTGEATRVEGSPMAEVTVIGQVDLDGDDVRDVVWARYEHEAGDAFANYHVAVWRSTTRASTPIVTLRNIRDLEISQDRVLAIYRDGGIDGWTYRCIDDSLALSTCAAADVRRRSMRATALAEDYTSDTTSPSDREELANDLDLLDVPVADRPRLLAMAAP